MIDYHCHLLPGLDDGPSSLTESIEMARILSDVGFTTICCTPHLIRGVYDTTPEAVRSAAAGVQAALHRLSLPLRLHPASEYYLDEFLLEGLGEPLLLPGKLILVEIPARPDPELVVSQLSRLIRRDLIPLIAHPERCDCLSADPGSGQSLLQRIVKLVPGFARSPAATGRPSLLSILRGMGCRFQGNLGSFAGMYGEKVKQRAEAYRQAGIYTHFGSDLHGVRQAEILKVAATNGGFF